MRVIRVRRLPCVAVLLAMILAGCETGEIPPTPPISPGSSASPREVNVIAKDYFFVPSVVDLVPGETVLLHVINGGLDVHEAIIGDQAVQDAWELAEAATVGHPPGPTPAVSVPPGVAGVRIVVQSGERRDVVWTVPDDPLVVGALIFGCHIPGHYAKGMWAPARVASDS